MYVHEFFMKNRKEFFAKYCTMHTSNVVILVIISASSELIKGFITHLIFLITVVFSYTQAIQYPPILNA